MRDEIPAEAQLVGRETVRVEVDAGSRVKDAGTVEFVELDAHAFLFPFFIQLLFVHVGYEPHVGGIAGVVDLRIHQQGLRPFLFPFERAQGVAPQQVEIHRCATIDIGFRSLVIEHIHNSFAEILSIVGGKDEFATFGKLVRELEVEIPEIVVG